MYQTNYHEYKGNKVLLYIDSIRKGHQIFPPSLQIALTDWCAFKCYMCDHWKREVKVHLNFPHLIEFLNKAKKENLETVCYSGGEPFMHKNINELMKWHVENNVEFGFISSGGFNIKNIDLELVRKASWVRFSLDAIEAEPYKQIRGQAILEQVLSNIDAFSKAGVNIGLGITLSQFNKNQLLLLANYAINKGIKEFRVWPVRHCDEAIDRNDFGVIGVLDRLVHLFKGDNVSHNLNDTMNIILNGEASNNFKTCKAVLYQLFIDATGKIFPCCILAGDTNADFQGTDFGQIEDVGELKDFEKVLKAWSERQVDGYCYKNCTKRLSVINTTYEQFENKKSFF